MMRAIRIALILAFVGGTSSALADPTISLVSAAPSGTIRISDNQRDGTAWIILKLDNLAGSELTAADPSVKDAPADSSGASVTFTAEPSTAPASGSSRSWRLKIEVKGLPPNYAKTRSASVRFADKETLVSYLLTNRPEGQFSWTLRPIAAAISITPSDSIPISISVTTVGATGIHPLAASPIEQTRKAIFSPKGFSLCEPPAVGAADLTVCGYLKVDANSSRLFWLRPNTSPYPGHYMGTVILASDQKPDGESVTLDIYVSSLGYQIVGVAVLAVGVLVSLFFLSVQRNRYNQAQALIPATLYSDRLASLKTTLGNAPAGVDKTKFARSQFEIDNLLRDLAPPVLEANQYIPHTWALSGGPSADAAGYKAYLARIDAWVAVLECVATRGMSVAWQQVTSAMTQAALDLLNDAIDAMDQLIPGTPDAPAIASVNVSVDRILGDLRTKLTAANHTARMGAPSLALPALPTSTERLTLQMRSIGWEIWIVTAVLSILAGVYAVIYMNPGFGWLTDYIFCIFWGFGLPTVGQNVAQMTNASVTNAVAVTMTK
jgi:hypothetical protein